MPTKDLSLTANFMKEEDYYAPKLSLDKKTLTYGMYPQNDRVTDTAIIQALNNSTAISDNLYKVGGKYYSKVIASPISNAKFSDGTIITNGQTYWFRYEPVDWKVVEAKNNEYIVISDEILDRHVFHNELNIATASSDGKTVFSNNWDRSDLRSDLQSKLFNFTFKFHSNNVSNKYLSSFLPSLYKTSKFFISSINFKTCFLTVSYSFSRLFKF